MFELQVLKRIFEIIVEKIDARYKFIIPSILGYLIGKEKIVREILLEVKKEIEVYENLNKDIDAT